MTSAFLVTRHEFLPIAAQFNETVTDFLKLTIYINERTSSFLSKVYQLNKLTSCFLKLPGQFVKLIRVCILRPCLLFLENHSFKSWRICHVDTDYAAIVSILAAFLMAACFMIIWVAQFHCVTPKLFFDCDQLLNYESCLNRARRA